MIVARPMFRVFATLVIAFQTGSLLALDPSQKFFQYESSSPNPDSGLPTEIFDVVEDELGFLWLATPRGLAKYDGVEATTFRVSRYPGLLSNRIRHLFVDSRNRLLVATEKGLSAFDGATFTPLHGHDADPLLVHAFAEDSAGVVWIAAEEGLWQLDEKSLTIKRNPADFGSIRSLLWHGNRLHVGGQGRVFVLQGDFLATIELPQAYQQALVYDLESHMGQVWGASGESLFYLNEATAVEVERDALNGVYIDVLLSDRDQNLWFASRETLGRFLPDGSIEIPRIDNNALGFSPEITELFEDSLGQHWHASSFFGLFLVRDTPIQRTSYTEGLLSTNVTAVASAPDKVILAATDLGVSAVSGGSTWAVIEQELSHRELIRSMHVDRFGQLLLGTESGLRLFSQVEDGWSEIDSGFQAEVKVNAIVDGVDDEIWVGTNAGLYRFSDRNLVHIAGTSNLMIESLLYDSSGKLWLGTHRGIVTYVDGTLEQQGFDSYAAGGTVVSLVELPTGALAAATADHGILFGVNDSWFHIGEEHGLPPEQVIDIEFRGQHLWVITGVGVFRTSVPNLAAINDRSVVFQPIIATQDYRAEVFANCCRGRNSNAALLAHDALVLASDDGIVTLGTSAIGSGEAVPRPYLKSATYAGTTKSLNGLTRLELQPDDHDIEIEYSALHLARGDQAKFRYRLKGFNDAWVRSGSDRVARFQSLPPGQFEFELQAAIHQEKWSSVPATLSIESIPGIFETTAFRAAAWLTALVAGMFLIWLWLAAARTRHSRLESLIGARTVELREINKQLKRANQELLDSTHSDPLTGLTNRRFFENAIQKGQLEESVPRTGILAMIDIDFFKRVNDARGHTSGDAVLRQFAALLASKTAPTDIVARWGGDEFLVVCCGDGKNVETILNGICAAVRDFDFQLPSGREVKLTCSIGCVRYPLTTFETLDKHFDSLLDIADDALYAVKVHGRDGWGLLENSADPTGNHDATALRAYQVGRNVEDLAGKNLLSWTTSRPGISLAISDTVTRLRAIASKDD